MNKVLLNQEYVNADEAQISAFDRGFLYGDGIYEAMRSIGQDIVQFDAHYHRLERSAESMQIQLPFSSNQLKSHIIKLIEMNQCEQGYIRVTISRGRGAVGYNQSLGESSTLLVIVKSFEPLASDMYQNGIEIITAETRRNAPEAINPAIKSISNLNSLLGRIEARNAGVMEVIMLNNKDEICEGSASNVFWTKDKTVFTPGASTGLLEGVTRNEIIHLCESQLKLNVQTGSYKMDAIRSADEVFMTSTSLEVMPVVKIDDTEINQKVVGEVSRNLLKEFRRLYERDVA